jgi:hypothetical protein
MSDVQRAPALKRVDPVEAAIPEHRPDAGAPGAEGAAAMRPVSTVPRMPGAAVGERPEALSVVLNTRVRPSTRDRLERALNKLRYETNNRNLSIASLTDTALDVWLNQQGL